MFHHRLLLRSHRAPTADETISCLTDVCPPGWSQQHTVEQLARKAGYAGRLSPEVLAAMDTTRYQSSKHAMTYDQYLAYTAAKG